jgi:RNA polymerase sigma-54 factor
MKPRLDLRLSQKLIMTPQLQQAIKLLQLSRLELSQVISQEMSENPLLEEVGQESEQEQEEETLPAEGGEEGEGETKDLESEWERQGEELRSQWEDYLGEDFARGKSAGTIENPTDDAPSYEQTLTRSPTLVDHLNNQLSLVRLSDREREIGQLIIGNIDENGYVRLSVEELSETSGAPVDQIESVLKIVQAFDPAGVAARDLRECLLIQVREKGIADPLVKAIISEHLPLVEVRKYRAIAKALRVSLEDVIAAVKIMETLEPKPGRPFFSNEAQTIIPDVYVVKSEGEYQVLLNDDGLPKLHVSSFYRKMLTSQTDTSGSVKQYLNDHLKSAVWLIRSIEQRNRTIYKVARSIVNLQREFFERGIGHLKPLVLRQVAEDINMHESTISRVTTNKYMHTPHGLFELKFFFTNSVGPREGPEGDLSSVTVREIIRQMVVEEGSDHPLRDQEIVDRLKEKNIHIARRTVAKYRAELKIPSASRRRKYV